MAVDTSDAAVVARWRVKLAGYLAALSYARRQQAYWSKQYHKATPGTDRRTLAYRTLKDRKAKVTDLEEKAAAARRVIARHAETPLRERAYAEAVKLIGVREQGGNNRGPEVEKIISEGGGQAGDAWCGWTLATVYKRAGSKAVTWHWGAVRLYVPLPDISVTLKPQRGDLVRFTFDHIGMFVKDNGDGTIQTIEGNTGATGAVSDSKTGGDGVHRKNRSKSLVRDYLHVTR